MTTDLNIAALANAAINNPVNSVSDATGFWAANANTLGVVIGSVIIFLVLIFVGALILRAFKHVLSRRTELPSIIFK